MYITREEYTGYGYSKVPKDDFARYAYNSEVIVRKYTFNRISDADLRPDASADSDIKRTAEMNQRGVCEIVDVLYAQDQITVGESGAAIKSFSNEGYSETLDTSRNNASETNRKIRDIMVAYFTAKQRYRGIR